MAEHYNGLTPAQAERLALFAEEAGEIVQAVGKALRHGLSSFHPADPDRTPNSVLIAREFGDLMAVAALMTSAGDMDRLVVVEAERSKHIRMAPYLHHQDDGGGCHD